MITVTTPDAEGMPGDQVKHEHATMMVTDSVGLTLAKGDGESVALYRHGHWTSAVAEQADTPPGLTLADDGELLNWQGTNYVRQAEPVEEVGQPDADAITVRLTGASDDLVEIDGDLSEEWSYDGERPAVVAFSDGTLLGIALGVDEQWHITTLAVGTALLTITPAAERPTDEWGRQPYSDEAALTGDVRWAVLSNSANAAPATR